MPPSRRNRPALERALPRDHKPGSNRLPARPELWHVLFGDGEWHPVHVRVWCEDIRGREVIDIEYRAGDGTHAGSYVVDRARIRAFEDGSED